MTIHLNGELLRQYSSNELRSNLLKLLQEGVLSDVQFTWQQKPLIRAHRAILAAASPVFAAAFSGRFQEAVDITHAINVDHCDPECFKRFVEFCYSGQVTLHSIAEAINVLKIAHERAVNSLVSICEQYLIAVLKAENCLPLLMLAQQFELSLLRHRSKMLVEDRPSIITKIPAATQYKDLVLSLLEPTSFQIPKILIYEAVLSWVDRTSVSIITQQQQQQQQQQKQPQKQPVPSTASSSNQNSTSTDSTMDSTIKTATSSTDTTMTEIETSREDLAHELIAEFLPLMDFAQFSSAELARLRQHYASVVPMNVFMDAYDIHLARASSKLHTTAVPQTRVLVMGGGRRATAEIYSSAQWNSINPMAVGRKGCAAVVLHGLIYNIGGPPVTGAQANMPQHEITEMAQQTVEIYDTARKKWTLAPPLLEPRSGLAAVAVDGTLYALGGTASLSGVVLDSFEKYRPGIDDSWIVEPSGMPTCLTASAAVVLRSNIYLLGGRKGNEEYTSDAWYLDTQADRVKWVKMPPMITARANHAAVVVNGRIYVIGGTNSDSRLDSIECYYPDAKQWETVPLKLSSPRSCLAAVGTRQGTIIVMGGVNTNNMSLNQVEELDLLERKVKQLPSMISARSKHSAVALN